MIITKTFQQQLQIWQFSTSVPSKAVTSSCKADHSIFHSCQQTQSMQWTQLVQPVTNSCKADKFNITVTFNTTMQTGSAMHKSDIYFRSHKIVQVSQNISSSVHYSHQFSSCHITWNSSWTQTQVVQVTHITPSSVATILILCEIALTPNISNSAVI